MVKAINVVSKGDFRVSYIVNKVDVNNVAHVSGKFVIEKENVPEWELEKVSKMVVGLYGEFEVEDVFVDWKTGSYAIRVKYNRYFPRYMSIDEIVEVLIDDVLKIREETGQDDANIDYDSEFSPEEIWSYYDWEE